MSVTTSPAFADQVLALMKSRRVCRSGAAVMLDLPPHLIPEWILIAGHPRPQERVLRAGAPKPLRARDLTYWERVGQPEPLRREDR